MHNRVPLTTFINTNEVPSFEVTDSIFHHNGGYAWGRNDELG